MTTNDQVKILREALEYLIAYSRPPLEKDGELPGYYINYREMITAVSKKALSAAKVSS